jgi:hypothetical protein
MFCRAAQRLLGGQFDYRLAAQQLEAAAQAVRTLSTAAAAAKAGGLQPGQMNIGSSSSSMDKPAAPQLPAYLAAAAAAGTSNGSEPGQLNSSSSSRNRTVGMPAAPELHAYSAAAGDGAASVAAATHASAAADAAAAAASWPGVLADVLSPLARFYDQEDGWQDVGAFSKVR